jgi:Protein of unknown function (DUF3999)
MTLSRTVTTAAVAVAAFGAVTGAQSNPEFTVERQVLSDGAGPRRLMVDETLLAQGSPFQVVKRSDTSVAERGLSDLRLFGADGRPVPYLLVQPVAGEPEWDRGRILPIAATKTTSGFEVDFGAARAIDMIRVSGLPSPFLKRLTLEGSGDRARWTTLVGEGTLFELPEEGLAQNTLAFTPGSFRYVRVVWNDTNSGRVPEPEDVAARRVSSALPSTPPTIETILERRASEPGVSRFHIRLPAAGLPIVALELDVGGGHVYRRAIVSESRFKTIEAEPVELGHAMLARVTREGITASALRIPVETPTEADLELTIQDGANPPLDVKRVSAVLAVLPWIYFEAPPGPIVARFGNRTLAAPVYDLEAVRASVDLGNVPEAKWGASSTRAAATQTRAGAPLPTVGAALDPSGFTFSRVLESPAAGLVALRLDAHALAHSVGPGGRFADVRLLDGSNRQIPYLVERRDEPLSIDIAVRPAADSQAAELKTGSGRPRTVYAVPLPYAELPSATLVVETSARVFQRTVWLGVDRPADRYRRDAWFDVYMSHVWRHTDDQTAGRPLTLSVPKAKDRELRLVIDEGDNAPLPLAGARLLLPAFRLRFYAPEQGPVRLVYGRTNLRVPEYDLALLGARVMGAAAQEIAAPALPAGDAPPTAPFITPRVFWLFLGAAVVVLVALIVRLVRTET